MRMRLAAARIFFAVGWSLREAGMLSAAGTALVTTSPRASVVATTTAYPFG